MSPNAADLVIRVLRSALELAQAAFSRAVVDRTAEDAALHSATLSLLGWGICEAHCVMASLTTPTPQGVSPNVRSLLESLLTARYLTDSAVKEERERRLERYFRGVRREQVKLRRALDDFPSLKAIYLVDEELATREETEYRKVEEALPQERRLDGKHWSGEAEGLKGVADKVAMGSDYAVQYRLHSGAAHSNRPWDQALFEEDSMLIIPALDRLSDTAVPLGFDSLRYLTWLLAVAFDCGAVTLYASEQEELASYRKYMEPLDVLHAKGIVGPGPHDKPGSAAGGQG